MFSPRSIKGDTIIHYTSQNWNLPHCLITDIAFHPESGLWIAAYEGLIHYFNDSFTLYPTEGPGPTSLAFDDDGSIWCGSYRNQLLHFKDSEYTYINLANNPLVTRPVRVLLIDTYNTKWISDGIGSLIVKTDSTFRFITPYRRPCVAIQDREGAIWVAFREGDIHMQKMTEFDTIVFDSTNSPLIATKLAGSSNPVKRRLINNMVADQNNHIWISTRYKGLYEYDGAQFINYTPENSEIPSFSTDELLIDSENNLWGGSNGLFKYDGETWTNWNTENSNIPGNEILSLSFDMDSVLWISCKEGGLSSFDGLDFTTYDPSNSGLLINTVYEILAEKDSVWLATSGAGLVVFDKKSQWTSFNVSNSGIASNNCNSIKRDKDGYLWIGHQNAGISVYKGDSIINHIEYYLGDQHELMVYPNPASEILYIQSSNGEQISQASIFDRNGRMLFSMPVEQLSNDHTLYQLHLADLKVTGIFVLKVKTTDGKSMSAPFFYSR